MLLTLYIVFKSSQQNPNFLHTYIKIILNVSILYAFIFKDLMLKILKTLKCGLYFYNHI